jgi:Polyketide cyclase / dehydrase and lipid transport
VQQASRHATERSDSYSVSIGAPPDQVWRILAQVESWPQFSPFAVAVERTAHGEYTITSPQGEVGLSCRFDADRLLLDHVVRLGDGTEVFIPYRVVPNQRGSELVMTNVKSPGDSMDEYEEQLRWMREELDGARRFVEQTCASAPSE